MVYRILVTGGAGFLGINLISELQKRNYEVYSLDLLHHHMENYIRCDVRSYRQLKRVFDKFDSFDFVYHLAAEYGRWNGEDYYENLWETNIIGTKHLLRLQEEKKFKMIFFSSAEVYGDYIGEMKESIMKTAPIEEVYQMNDYAISKWAGELMCINSSKMFGTETVRVRPVNCYGPHEVYHPYRGFIPKFIYHVLHKIPYIVYKGHKRIIDYVEDSCRTFANIINNFIPGEAYNIGGRIEWEKDIKEINDLILKTCDVIDDSFIKYKDQEPYTTQKKTMDFSKAVKDLNHNPLVPPEEGIQKTVEWMKNHYSLG
ncbi:MAG: NAD-dependent epimerase/dehydratase family protein [Candidatus Hodarchaeota archaeon]